MHRVSAALPASPDSPDSLQKILNRNVSRTMLGFFRLLRVNRLSFSEADSARSCPAQPQMLTDNANESGIRIRSIEKRILRRIPSIRKVIVRYRDLDESPSDAPLLE